MMIDYSTGVLCGCLKLLRALIESGKGLSFRECANILIQGVGGKAWSEHLNSNDSKGMFSLLALPFLSLGGGMKEEDMASTDLMGAVFDGFLSSASANSI
uniref:Uncharacterized protein n=1 Tax=Ditylum brightwellii TaxID=49249 RepID=A0A6U3UNA5_9STRA|mmetsp:Transcript_4841/g.7418  ORF Transcript_4841/g.7418 Transcript_4841/m.7418 type:complete len:100 (+) Transcript_4841:680-979(+)